MKSLLNKELRLAVHPLSWIFLAFSVMALIPGYPILVGAFFICFGIFQTFQRSREANDVLYTVLLPVEKSDVVRARFLTVCFFQLIAFALTAALTILRMTLLGQAAPYVNNFMMNATPAYLAYVLLVFTLFNVLFAGPYFRTAYHFGKPFVTFIAVSFLLIVAAETLHHIPGLEFLNTGERLPVQLGLLLLAAAIYAGGTALSCRRAMARFALLDL